MKETLVKASYGDEHNNKNNNNNFVTVTAQFKACKVLRQWNIGING
jgi:hypothetical protein